LLQICPKSKVYDNRFIKNFRQWPYTASANHHAEWKYIDCFSGWEYYKTYPFSGDSRDSATAPTEEYSFLTAAERLEGSSEKLPRIIFLFDEFGDLWDCCTKLQVDKLENLIIRLGQKARAAGIHLIIFTQRPKKVVSPRLRSNCPARVLLTVADSADSEAILGNKSFDGSQLLGRGDLFFNSDRLQALLSDESDFAKLTKGKSQLTAIDKLTQVDELTSIDSHLSPLNSQSSARQLSKPLQSIFDYAKRQDNFVTASQVKANVRLFRDSPVNEIRNYFQWLADNSYGNCRGADDNLEFSAI
jgi:DNA segregation ATPase FtsK/SpoIIIE-like protein